MDIVPIPAALLSMFDDETPALVSLHTSVQSPAISPSPRSLAVFHEQGYKDIDADDYAQTLKASQYHKSPQNSSLMLNAPVLT